MAYSKEVREQARKLYLQCWEMKDICDELELNSLRVVYQWRDKDNWDEDLDALSHKQKLARQITALLDKPEPTQAELNKLETLFRLQDRLDKSQSNKAPSEPKAKKGKPVKNDVSGITQAACDKVANDLFFDYQLTWRAAKLTQRIRFILKSRQIGATYYFAYEAFEDAVLTGDNQIFVSASRAQAMIFRSYIVGMAKSHFDVELKGNPIVLSNGAELHFLSTNAKTAQGYHGHFYFDEIFWTYGFSEFYKNASAMSSQKKWRRTLFSTPSSINHDGYKLWSGEKYNAGRSEDDKKDIDTTHATLKHGHRGPDRIWRHIVTIKDAEAQGCDLFDIEELEDEYSTNEFNNLFMCHFIDDAESVFSLSDLLAGAVEPEEHWPDFNPTRRRPFGNKKVWLGYDPSRVRDNAVLTILAPPVKSGGKFRVLDRIIIHGKRFQHHCKKIEQLIKRYKVDYLGMDTSGIGGGVFDYVQEVYPKTRAITYSVQTKNDLVRKAIDVIEEHRLEYDSGHTDIPAAFLTVRQVSTDGGAITYASNRTDKTGHGDVAWSIMHALINEPINHNRQQKSEYD